MGLNPEPSSPSSSAWGILISHAMGLNSLPTEILDQICELLLPLDLQELRLACRRLGNIAASHVFRRVVITISKSSLDRLSTIANHPVYSHYVRELFYTAEFIVIRHSQQPMTIYEYVARCREVENARIASYHRGYIPLPEEPRRSKPSQIKANYEVYKTVWEDQQHILRHGHDAEVITKLLPKFSNLTCFTVPDERIPPLRNPAYYNPLTSCNAQTVWDFTESRGRERVESPGESLYLRDMFEDPHGAHEGLRKAKVVADAIRANVVHPTRFCHAYLHHFFFDPRINNSLDGLIPLLGNLTHFEIGIRMTSVEPHGFTRQACRSTLRQHALQAMIAAMPNLEVLSLSFPDQEHSRGDHLESPIVKFFADLHDAIPAHHVIPRLRRLWLSGVETTLDELLGLYTRHRGTLKVFQLNNIRLAEASWSDLLPALKGTLARDVIEEVGFGGYIYGCGPEAMEGVQRYEVWCFNKRRNGESNPKTERRETRVAGASDLAPTLGERLAKYLMRDDETELPISQDNAVYGGYIPVSGSIGEEHVDAEFWKEAMNRIMQGGYP